MIRTSRQLEVTKEQLAKLEAALEQLQAQQENVHPALVAAQRRALESQIEELWVEVANYTTSVI